MKLVAEAGLYHRVLAEINRIAIVDSHEHLISEQARLRRQIDFFSWFAHYSSTDLLSVGMPAENLERMRNPEVQLQDRWEELAPYWPRIRNTGYSKVLIRAANDLFDIEDINATTWRKLSEEISASNVEGRYHQVLKTWGNFERCILQELHWRAEEFGEEVPRDIDTELFAPVAMFDRFAMISSRRSATLPGGSVYPPGLDSIGEEFGERIHSLDHLLDMLDLAFEREAEKGVVGVKCALAYHRSLEFDRPGKNEAERLFNGILTHYEGHGARPPTMAYGWDQLKPFQNYMMHQIVQRSIDHGLPVQFHTGLQEGVGNILAYSKPTHLTNLFMQYPDAKFVVFHAGFPFARDAAVLAKSFPNVYVDLCWIWSLGFGVARRILDEWIEVLPSTKILAFGGDYMFLEGAYAVSRIAREGVARLLASRVEDGYFGETEAIGIAIRILRENAMKLYRLK